MLLSQRGDALGRLHLIKARISEFKSDRFAEDLRWLNTCSSHN